MSLSELEKTLYLPDCFRIFYTLNNKMLLEAQIGKYNKKLSTKPNTNDTPQDKTKSKLTAPPHLHSYIIISLYF